MPRTLYSCVDPSLTTPVLDSPCIDAALSMQTTTQQLTLERESALEEERARADQLEEQRSVAQLQNELLTEMVAAEQVGGDS